MSLLSRLFARQPLAWTTHAHEGHTLRRALGWPALTCIGLGTMLGGIFPTIGAGAHSAGPAVILSFLICGLVCVAVALCYAELASMVPVAGSAYTYAYATLGEIVAWIIGWDLILEYGISAAPVASSFSAYAQGLLTEMHMQLPTWAQTANFNWGHSQVDVIAAGVVLLLSALLAAGIRETSFVNIALVAVQIVAMLGFGFFVGPHVHTTNLHPWQPFGWSGIFVATSLVFFAYIGFDTVTVASEEAVRPQRDVPIGILLSLVIGAALYVWLTWVTVGTLSYTKLSDGAAMLDAAKASGTGAWMIWLVGIAGVTGNTTVMLTSLLGQVRIFYVMARDRMLPPGVARIHPRFRTPAHMTMITGVVVAILAAIVPLDTLLKFVNIGTLSAFAIVSAGVLVLRFAQPDAPRPFKIPGGVLVASIGLLSSLAMIFYLGRPTFARFILWFFAGIVIYALYGFRKSRLAQASGVRA